MNENCSPPAQLPRLSPMITSVLRVPSSKASMSHLTGAVGPGPCRAIGAGARRSPGRFHPGWWHRCTAQNRVNVVVRFPRDVIAPRVRRVEVVLGENRDLVPEKVAQIGFATLGQSGIDQAPVGEGPGVESATITSLAAASEPKRANDRSSICRPPGSGSRCSPPTFFHFDRE